MVPGIVRSQRINEFIEHPNIELQGLRVSKRRLRDWHPSLRPGARLRRQRRRSRFSYPRVIVDAAVGGLTFRTCAGRTPPAGSPGWLFA